MKRRLSILSFAIAFVMLFASCSKDDTTNSVTSLNKGTYILNYGDFSGGKGTISLFDTSNDSVLNNYYELVNGVVPVSNLQTAYNYNGKVYFTGNAVDEVFLVDNKSFLQTENAISSDKLVGPRSCVAQGDILYVSCWGGKIWEDESLSYIAKIDLSTKTVIGTIALPGGPEGIEIAHGKLYAALNYKDSVAVIDLADEAISYIETPAVTSYFIKDNDDNLYVSLLSTFSDFSASEGLGLINTVSDKLEYVYPISGVSSSYVNIMAPNADFSKLYVMTSVYDADWNLKGAVAVFNVESKSFEDEMFVEGVSALNGIAVNATNNDVYCLIAQSVTSGGTLKIYDKNGKFKRDHNTGNAPSMIFTVK